MIRSVRFQNCQSFADVTLDFVTDRLNVIIAENDTGKSILFKVLKLAGCPKYYSRQERADLIRRGSPYALVVFRFTDDSYGMMRICPDKTIYAFLETKHSSVSAVLEPPSEMLERLGLLADSESNFVANIIDSDQDLLLVNSNLSYNYALVRMIVVNDDLDTLLERLETLQQEFQGYLFRAVDRQGLLERQLENLQYADVQQMERELIVSEAVFRAVYLFVDVFDVMTGLKVCQEGSLNLDTLLVLEQMLESSEHLLDGMELLGKVAAVADVQGVDLLFLFEKIASLMGTMFVVRGVAIDDDALSALQKLEAVQSLLRDFEVIGSHNDFELEGLVGALSHFEGISMAMRDVSDASFDIKVTKENIEEYQGMFAASGDRFACPIYGEVIYDGKNCVVDCV